MGRRNSPIPTFWVLSERQLFLSVELLVPLVKLQPCILVRNLLLVRPNGRPLLPSLHYSGHLILRVKPHPVRPQLLLLEVRNERIALLEALRPKLLRLRDR